MEVFGGVVLEWFSRLICSRAVLDFGPVHDFEPVSESLAENASTVYALEPDALTWMAGGFPSGSSILEATIHRRHLGDDMQTWHLSRLRNVRKETESRELVGPDSRSVEVGDKNSTGNSPIDSCHGMG